MQKVKPYTQLAKIYRHLMSNIDYRDWSDYLSEILLDLKVKPTVVLELSAGICQLSGFLKKHFKYFFVTDKSINMLSSSNEEGIKKICCDMLSIPFKTKFDFIFSAFDSINYLLQYNQINLLFENIQTVMKDEGYFTFDVSLEENSLLNTKDLNREGVYNGIKYKQKSFYNRIKRIHTNQIEIILDSNEEFLEIHRQRIYKFEDYFKYIEKNGLFVYQCYDAFTFNDATNNSERAQFIVKKR